MSAKAEIERKIQEYAEKLRALVKPEDKRIKKRILQNLGKLKKKVAELGDAAPAPQAKDEQVAPAMKLSRKAMKAKVKLLNKDLAECAQKKLLKVAMKKFASAVNKGFEPDMHTYANMINVHVRCSDLQGALKLLAKMENESKDINIVVLGTLLKGYSESGDVIGAYKFFCQDILGRAHVVPNVRVVNTLLRGCTRVGAVRTCSSIYRSMIQTTTPISSFVRGAGEGQVCSKFLQKMKSVQPDSSTYEYVVALLTQALEIEEASEIISVVASQKNDEATSLAAGATGAKENAALYISVAKACALLCDWNAAGKWCACAEAALRESQSAALRETMRAKLTADKRERLGADASKHAHKKRKMNDSKTINHVEGSDDDDDDDDDDSDVEDDENSDIGEEEVRQQSSDQNAERSKRSVALFLQHRRAELRAELEVLTEYINRCKETSAATLSSSGGEKRADRLKLRLMSMLSRVLYFGFDGRSDIESSSIASDAEDTETLNDALYLALCEKFGLQKIVPSHKKAKEKVQNILQNSGKNSNSLIDFDVLFMPTDQTSDEMARSMQHEFSKLPLKLEICTGSGEWLVEQATADIDRSSGVTRPAGRWVGLELRCDRVHDTLCRAMFSSPANSISQPGIQTHAQVSTNGEIVPELCMNDNAAESERHTDGPNSTPDRGIHSAIPIAGLDNVAIIGGDADRVLRRHVAAEQFDSVFVNHPEPPERLTGEGDSQGKHLLTKAFLQEILRTLKVDGTLTIVTDNLPYGKSLGQSFAALYEDVQRQRRGDIRAKGGETEQGGSAHPYTCYVSVAADIAGDRSGLKLQEEILLKESEKRDKVDLNRKGHGSRNTGNDMNRKSSGTHVIDSRVESPSTEKLTPVQPKAAPKAAMKPEVPLYENSDTDDTVSNSDTDDGDEGSDSDDDEGRPSSVPVSNDNKSHARGDLDDSEMAIEVQPIHSKRNAKTNSNERKTSSRLGHGGSGSDSGNVALSGVTNTSNGQSGQAIRLWRGDAGPAEGHLADASSYFDRMWARGEKKRRWFLHVKKIVF